MATLTIFLIQYFSIYTHANEIRGCLEVQFRTGGDLGRNELYNCNRGKISDRKNTFETEKWEPGHNRLPQY